MDGLLICKHIELLSLLIKAQDGVIKAKNELLLCYKMQRRPSERLFSDIQKWTDTVNKLKKKLDEF